MCPSHFCRVRVTSSSSQSHLKFFRVTRTVESLWVIFICLQARVNVDCNIRALSHKVKYDCNVQRIGTNINKLTASKHATMRSSTFCIFRETGEPTRFSQQDLKHGCRKGAGGILKILEKKVVFIVLSWKKQISPLLSAPGKILEKSPGGHPWKKILPTPMASKVGIFSLQSA